MLRVAAVLGKDVAELENLLVRTDVLRAQQVSFGLGANMPSYGRTNSLNAGGDVLPAVAGLQLGDAQTWKTSDPDLPHASDKSAGAPPPAKSSPVAAAMASGAPAPTAPASTTATSRWRDLVTFHGKLPEHWRRSAWVGIGVIVWVGIGMVGFCLLSALCWCCWCCCSWLLRSKGAIKGPEGEEGDELHEVWVKKRGKKQLR